MNKRYTAAHWGVYEALGFGNNLQLRPVEGDANPSMIGAGWVSAMRDNEARIQGPCVRRGWLENRDTQRNVGDSFMPVSWDDALDLAAGELERVRSKHGNNALFAGSYGWASAGRFHHAQSHLRRFLNTIGGFTRSVDTYSHAAAEVLLPHITGMTHRQFQDQLTSWASIAEHCECLVAFGGISSRTAQITSSGTSVHDVESWLEQALVNGMKTILVSPQRSDFGDQDRVEWVSIRPGTDTAMMLAIAHELIRTEAVDRSFLQRHTVGWSILEAYVTGSSDGVAKTPKWAAEICGVAAGTIRDLADQMASSRSGWGLPWQPCWDKSEIPAQVSVLDMEVSQPQGDRPNCIRGRHSHKAGTLFPISFLWPELPTCWKCRARNLPTMESDVTILMSGSFTGLVEIRSIITRISIGWTRPGNGLKR